MKLLLLLVLLISITGGSSECDLACWLQNITFSFPGIGFEIGRVESFECGQIVLANLSSAFQPPVSVAVNVADLSLQCNLMVSVFGGKPFLVTAHSVNSTVTAKLTFVMNNSTGLASSSVLHPCGASVILDLHVEDHRVLTFLVSLLETLYQPKINKAICTELTQLVDTNLTSVLTVLNGAMLPFLGENSGTDPPVIIPNYDPELLLNFTGNPLIGLADFLLDDLIGHDGPFGVNRIASSLTNNTGAVFIDLGDNGTEVTTVDVAGLGNVTFGIYNVSIRGLTSFNMLHLLVPQHSFSLDSQIGLDEFQLNVSFFVNTVLSEESGATLSDDKNLFESGRLVFGAANLSIGFAVFAEIDKLMATRFNLDQIISVGCLKAAVLGANVTQARLNFQLQTLLIEAVSNVGGLESNLDNLVDSLMLLFVTSYNKVIPAFVNAVLLAPAIDTANAALFEKVLSAPEPCAMQQASSSSSAFPLNPLSSSIVLGAAIGLWLIVFGLVSQHQWVLYKRRKEEEKFHLGGGEEDGLTQMENVSLNVSFDSRPVIRHSNALGLNSDLSWWLKIFVPFLIIGNIGLFVVSNTSVGASVFVYIHLGNDTVTTSSLFSFSLANSVHDMWVAGVYPLSLIVAVFSGCWPYLKLLLMLGVWFLPVRTVLRENVLIMLDMLGKWSLIDAFVLVFMMVAFRFQLVIPASPLAHTKTGDAWIDLVVEGDMGIYSFLLATMVSLLITHIILACHRWLEEKKKSTDVYMPEGPSDPPDSNKQRMAQVAFPTGRGTLVRASKLGMVTVFLLLVLSLGLVTWGALSDSFVFHFRGAAGALFPYAGVVNDRSYSLVSLAMALPGAALNPEAFGVRWVQATFLLFALVVPQLYLVTLIVMWVFKMKRTTHHGMFVLAEILRAWSAMEVFVLSVIAALTELEQFAQFLVGDRCDFINPILSKYFAPFLDGNTKCFDVTTTLTSGCWIMFVGCVLYIVAGQIVMSVCHELVYPSELVEGDKLSRKARFLIAIGMCKEEK